MKHIGWTLIAVLLGACGSSPQPAPTPGDDGGSATDAATTDAATTDAATADAATTDAATTDAATTDAATTACNALPAAGTWDSTSIAPVVSTGTVSFDFTGKSMAVIVDPFDAATVWLGTGDKGLFKSTDCGATWAKVNTGTNGSALDQSALWSMVVDPINKGVIYTVAAYGAEGLWKSTNGGVDWTQLFPASSQFAQLAPNNFVGNVSMDPADPKHLVVASHGACASPYPNGCMAESLDGGATWPNIVGMPATWGENGGVQVVNATTWIWGTGDGANGLYVTTNNGQAWTQVLPGGGGDGNGELTIRPLQRAIDGAYYVSSIQGVLRSLDGVAWSLAWSEKNFQLPSVSGIAFSSKTIFAAKGLNFFSAPISDYSNWSAMQGPTANNDSAGFLAYDEAHHLLYASCWGGGLFRMVTQ